MKYQIVALNSGLDKKNFDCGNEQLNNYLHKQAGQDVKRKLCAVSAIIDNNRVIGYYTLSNTSIAREAIPEELRKKMPPSYYNLPATLLGRLAIDLQYKGQGLGEYLLIDALKKSFTASVEYIGSMAVVVDPIDEAATNFYSKYDFIKLPDSGKMFLPMQTVAQLFT
ncbi:GNAT family N-acetyltransferase [Mucilaginibacter celer]|uniref:GNAT family N-acetyltransferase n=1 Tax=Mucilaginibacter celer TaxID=2305508 RepID=A0A494VP40_9SPHI|nr:GNAT family N-acetyltransferase [Mucilaginibacter celer]AYL97216.1 GNAT family N-acetyltransferase [Mucilaginibacter celer]